MASQAELPTVEALRRAFLTEAAAAARARGEQADTHAGSLYDHAAGAGAILHQRVAARDRDEFLALYYGQADSRGLDILADSIGCPREEGAKGTGTLRVSRPSSGAAGWFRRGTRIAAGGSFEGPACFAVAIDQWAPASATTATLPIEAGAIGKPAFRMAAGDPGSLRWEDPIWDAGWKIDAIECAAGTPRQQDHELRAAMVDARRSGRRGYARALSDACKAAGSSFVALFASDYLGSATDGGLNRIYVADSADQAGESLLRACRLAIVSVGMAGACLQILPAARVGLEVDLLVTLHERINATGHLGSDVVGAVVDYFSDVVLWRTSAIKGAVFRALPGLVRSVDVLSPIGEPPPAMPAVLNRYDVPAHAVRVSFMGT